MLLDKQWQLTYPDASVSPVTPHNPLMCSLLKTTGLLPLQSVHCLYSGILHVLLLCVGDTNALVSVQ